MDPATASYYRAVLYADGMNEGEIPKSLQFLHQWALKRHLALGLGGTIHKAAAFTVALTWLSSTEEGRKFAAEKTPLGDFFSEPPAEQAQISTLTAEEWDTLPAESKVVVLEDNKQKPGQFMGRRGGWVDIRVDGEVKPFRTSKVQLAGA